MLDPKELFKPGRYEPTQAKEADLTPEQIMARGRMMQELIRIDAWDLLDSHVSESVEYLLAEIEMAKDPMEIKRLQGQLSGIKALRLVVLGFIEKADQMQQSLQQEQREASKT